MPTPRRTLVLISLLLGITPPLLAQAPGDSLPEWRRGGTCYEVFVRSFRDSDSDGIGDLRGLTQKLDYINDGNPGTRTDLGANCIWLMPVAQSPSYHGYDVTNYYAVDRDYGSNEDFKRLVAEAHRRGIRVLVDLVLNHSSAAHPYFQSAALDPASPFRDWFQWSNTPKQVKGWSQPVWHRSPFGTDYYYGLFWSGMPDLNLANPEVRAETERIARYWLEEMGVDGFRLDAVAHFFESADDVKHGPGTHQWLRDFQSALERIKPGVFTVGEVWDSLSALQAYYPNQLDAYFAFDVSNALIEAVRTGKGGELMRAVERTQRALPEGGYAPFLRNHDQTRTATELGGDVARQKLAATLLLTLPGLPFVYYGEEIGMTGDKPDPRLRTPMQWTREPAAGFTRGVAWEPLQPDSFTANVAAMEPDPNSLLNRYRELIHLRAAQPALGEGRFVPLTSSTDAAIAYLRRSDEQTVLVVANLGEQPLRGAMFSAEGTGLRAGRWVARPLLGGGGPTTLRVGAEGRVQGWRPAPALLPFESRVFELVAGR